MGHISRHRFLALCIAGVCVAASGTPAAAKPTIIVEGGNCSDIQAAIDSVPPSGGLVRVRDGTYECAEPIVIDRDHVELRGEGPETVLRLADGANSPVLIIGQTQATPTVTRKRIRVSDLTIDGNRANQSSETWSEVPEIRNNGIAVRGAKNVVVERVVVHDAASGGLVSERGCRSLTVRNFAAYENAFDGLAGYVTEKSRYTDLYLYDNGAAGLSFDLAFNGNVIQHALVTGSGRVGIFMRFARRNAFKDVTVIDSTEHGIFLAENRDPSVVPPQPATENTFRSVFVVGSGQAGIRINDLSCVDNRLIDAQLVDNAGGCISEDAPVLETSGIVCRPS